MPLVDALVAELDGIPEYLAESRKLVSDINTLQEAQAITIGAKIQNLKNVTLPEAALLKKKIAQVGWSVEENKKLSALVDEVVGKTCKAPRRCSQRCGSWELYPTEADWDILGDRDTPWSVKYGKVADICKRIGLLLPTGPTRGRILEALLLANGLPIERDKEFYAKLDRLSDALEPLHKVTWGGGHHLEGFPTSPKGIPQKHYQYTYDKSEPALRELPGLDAAGSKTANVRRSCLLYTSDAADE